MTSPAQCLLLYTRRAPVPIATTYPPMPYHGETSLYSCRRNSAPMNATAVCPGRKRVPSGTIRTSLPNRVLETIDGDCREQSGQSQNHRPVLEPVSSTNSCEIQYIDTGRRNILRVIVYSEPNGFVSNHFVSDCIVQHSGFRHHHGFECTVSHQRNRYAPSFHERYGFGSGILQTVFR